MSELLHSHPPVVDENTVYTGEDLYLPTPTLNGCRKSSDESLLTAPRSRKDTAYSDDLSNYYIPRREIPQNERLERFCGYLYLTVDQMKELMFYFQDELQKGLEAHKRHPNEWIEEESCFKMIDSCVEELPTGDETGIYYAVDFGGTNLRAVRVELQANRKIERTQVKYSLKYEGPSAHDKGLLDGRSTAKDLFDHFSSRIKRIMEISGDLNERDIDFNPVPVGFTFSFPCMQTNIDNSVLLEWTKGFETGRLTDDPVERRDVGKLLDEAFKRLNTPARLVAILNDTVGTLLSCSYQKSKDLPDCLIGLILGTGVNGCYVQPNASNFGYKGKVINIELGNFNKNLPFTEVDLELDWHASNKGYQLFEKQISGAYLGELVRRYVIRVFQYRAPAKAWVEETITAEDVAKILNDSTPELSLCRQCISDRWGVNMEFADLRDIQNICIAVFDRSAKLASVAICAMALQTGRLADGVGSLTCGVDGSLYVKNPWYAEKVRSHMKNLLGDVAKRIHVMPSDDGSGKGAAILAAVVSKSANTLFKKLK